MTSSEIITIAALIVGPIAAVQSQRIIEQIREAQNGRISIFKMLMVTRGSSPSSEHIDALNRIDLEFFGKKRYRKVLDAWNIYYAHLNKNPSDSAVWIDRKEELLNDLLYEMGQSLGYKFDRALINRKIYDPDSHMNVEIKNKN